MTKTISLADDAYEALVSVRQAGESFSELARRAAKELARRRLFDRQRKPLWSATEESDMVKRLYKERDASRNPRSG